MEMLKKYFPLAFAAKKEVVALVINILIHIVADTVAGIAIGLLSGIPLVGALISILGGVIGLYFTVSLVLSILDYLKILK